MEELNAQDQEFVKEVTITGNRTQAAIKAYGIKDENYAGVKGHRLIRSDKIQNAIKSLADRVPDDKLHEVLMEGLEATKRSGTGGMKIGIGTDGKVNDFGHTEIDEPDYAVRHKYLDTALKLKGLYEDGAVKPVVIMPVLVKFLDNKNDESSDNGDTL